MYYAVQAPDACHPRARREHVLPGLPSLSPPCSRETASHRVSSRTSATGSCSRTECSCSQPLGAAPLDLSSEHDSAHPPLRDRRLHRVHAFPGSGWCATGAVCATRAGAEGAVVNGVGATATGIVTAVVVVTKFAAGAWIVTIAIPVLVLVCSAFDVTTCGSSAGCAPARSRRSRRPPARNTRSCWSSRSTRRPWMRSALRASDHATGASGRSTCRPRGTDPASDRAGSSSQTSNRRSKRSTRRSASPKRSSSRCGDCRAASRTSSPSSSPSSSSRRRSSTVATRPRELRSSFACSPSPASSSQTFPLSAG